MPRTNFGKFLKNRKFELKIEFFMLYMFTCIKNAFLTQCWQLTCFSIFKKSVWTCRGVEKHSLGSGECLGIYLDHLQQDALGSISKKKKIFDFFSTFLKHFNNKRVEKIDFFKMKPCIKNRLKENSDMVTYFTLLSAFGKI